MNEEEMRYRVSVVVTSTLQIVVQARDSEEAEAFADAIDFDKWSIVNSEYVSFTGSFIYFVRKNWFETSILKTEFNASHASE